MKEISEVEEKPFTSSLIINICTESCCRKGLEWVYSLSVDISFKRRRNRYSAPVEGMRGPKGMRSEGVSGGTCLIF
jgi:hypothetical protein